MVWARPNLSASQRVPRARPKLSASQRVPARPNLSASQRVPARPSASQRVPARPRALSASRMSYLLRCILDPPGSASQPERVPARPTSASQPGPLFLPLCSYMKKWAVFFFIFFSGDPKQTPGGAKTGFGEIWGKMTFLGHFGGSRKRAILGPFWTPPKRVIFGPFWGYPQNRGF